MADPRQSPTALPHAATSEPVELGDGQLDGVAGGHEETVIFQFGAIELTNTPATVGQVRGDGLQKSVTKPARG